MDSMEKPRTEADALWEDIITEITQSIFYTLEIPSYVREPAFQTVQESVNTAFKESKGRFIEYFNLVSEEKDAKRRP